jgi:hypothetical protein
MIQEIPEKTIIMLIISLLIVNDVGNWPVKVLEQMRQAK